MVKVGMRVKVFLMRRTLPRRERYDILSPDLSDARLRTAKRWPQSTDPLRKTEAQHLNRQDLDEPKNFLEFSKKFLFLRTFIQLE